MIVNVKTQKIGSDGTAKFVFPTKSARFLIKNLTSHGITAVLGDDLDGCYIPSGYMQLIVCADQNVNADPGTNIVTVHGTQEDERVLGVEIQSIPFGAPVLLPAQLVSNMQAYTTVSVSEIRGVTAPVTGATAVTAITPSDEYTGAVTWSPGLDDGKFKADTAYTATITISPIGNASVFGVPTDFFTVSGATATNDANSGVISAVFPKTT